MIRAKRLGDFGIKSPMSPNFTHHTHHDQNCPGFHPDLNSFPQADSPQIEEDQMHLVSFPPGLVAGLRMMGHLLQGEINKYL